jgi:tetratricopeptide (TPR) repeat protein
MGRYEDAIQNYKKAVELNPKFTASQAKIGTNLVLLGKYEEGREAVRKAMEMEMTPRGKVFQMRTIARSFIYEGNPQQALVEFDNALKMATEAGLPEQQASIHSVKCFVNLESGNPEQAEQSLAACKKVVASSDLSAATKENFAKGALYSEAMIAAKRKDFANAMTKADEYKAKIDVGKNPKEMENHHALLGRILKRVNMPGPSSISSKPIRRIHMRFIFWRSLSQTPGIKPGRLSCSRKLPIGMRIA